MRSTFYLLSFATLLVSCDQAPADGGNSDLAVVHDDGAGAVAADAEVAEIDEEGSIGALPIADTWQISESTDPFSDQILREAHSLQSVSSYVAETNIRCVGGKITYTIAVFGEFEQPIPFLKSTEMWTHGPRVRHRARVRLDDADATRISDYEPRYDNAIEIASTNSVAGIDARHFAAAEHIALGFELGSGDVTLLLEQKETALREMLSHCLSENGWEGI